MAPKRVPEEEPLKIDIEAMVENLKRIDEAEGSNYAGWFENIQQGLKVIASRELSKEERVEWLNEIVEQLELIEDGLRAPSEYQLVWRTEKEMPRPEPEVDQALAEVEEIEASRGEEVREMVQELTEGPSLDLLVKIAKGETQDIDRVMREMARAGELDPEKAAMAAEVLQKLEKKAA